MTFSRRRGPCPHPALHVLPLQLPPRRQIPVRAGTHVHAAAGPEAWPAALGGRRQHRAAHAGRTPALLEPRSELRLGWWLRTQACLAGQIRGRKRCACGWTRVPSKNSPEVHDPSGQ